MLDNYILYNKIHILTRQIQTLNNNLYSIEAATAHFAFFSLFPLRLISFNLLHYNSQQNSFIFADSFSICCEWKSKRKTPMNREIPLSSRKRECGWTKVCKWTSKKEMGVKKKTEGIFLFLSLFLSRWTPKVGKAFVEFSHSPERVQGRRFFLAENLGKYTENSWKIEIFQRQQRLEAKTEIDGRYIRALILWNEVITTIMTSQRRRRGWWWWWWRCWCSRFPILQ